MWSTWAFCEVVHISMATPCLSIEKDGVQLVRTGGVGFFDCACAGWFSLYSDKQGVYVKVAESCA